MNERLKILNAIAKKRSYSTYLEIGLGSKKSRIFNKVKVLYKASVDPNEEDATYKMDSDEYFAGPGDMKGWDLIFIDGRHHADQVHRDLANALQRLNEGGSIVVHDCNPRREALQMVPEPYPDAEWTGDVWKAWVWYRIHRDDLSMCVIDVDYGCGIIQGGGQKCFPASKMKAAAYTGELDYAFLELHRKELLNLVPFHTWK